MTEEAPLYDGIPVTIRERLLMDAMTGKPIAFFPAYVPIAGGINAALLLSQACYWTKHLPPERDGWFYKSQAEWEEETGLKRREQENARRSLRQNGLLEEERRGLDPTIWFRVNMDKIIAELVQNPRSFPDGANVHQLMAVSSISCRTKAPSPYITENTSEITDREYNSPPSAEAPASSRKATTPKTSTPKAPRPKTLANKRFDLWLIYADELNLTPEQRNLNGKRSLKELAIAFPDEDSLWTPERFRHACKAYKTNADKRGEQEKFRTIRNVITEGAKTTRKVGGAPVDIKTQTKEEKLAAQLAAERFDRGEPVQRVDEAMWKWISQENPDNTVDDFDWSVYPDGRRGKLYGNLVRNIWGRSNAK